MGIFHISGLIITPGKPPPWLGTSAAGSLYTYIHTYKPNKPTTGRLWTCSRRYMYHCVIPVREHPRGGGGRHAENKCRRQNNERWADHRRPRRDPHKGPHKSGPPHRGPHKAVSKRPQKDPHRKHTDNSISVCIVWRASISGEHRVYIYEIRPLCGLTHAS